MSKKDTCSLIEKIKDVLDEHKVKTLTNYKLDDKYYLITDFMLITYNKYDSSIDIAFHVATRPDISSFFTLVLTNFDEVKDINIMEVYMKDKEGQILTGDECIKQHQKNVRSNIIDDFVGDQVQTHYLQTTQIGGEC
ncbi:hypothetical protein KKF82_06610 [Patescibacteria group bacterium]|nr:hypothetical protein [Patescibacteria group bacterium]